MTNDLSQLSQLAPQAWHGLTMAHAFVLAVAGWVTHTNWPKVVQAGTWIAQHGGVVGIGRALLLGTSPIADRPSPSPDKP